MFYFLMNFYQYSNSIILKINKRISNKLAKAILLLLISPYIFLKFCFCKNYEQLIGRRIQKKRIAADKKRQFKYELGLVAIAKNEGQYIREWIAYHLTVCNMNTVIYLYDNDSTDNLKELISDYIAKGYVVYKYFPGEQKQLAAYEDAIATYSSECRYLGFIDVDEFIYDPNSRDLIETVKDIIDKEPNAVGLGINWMIFGSSNKEVYEPELVTERFTYHAQDDFWGNLHVKTICNPRFVSRFISCHYPLYHLGAWSINTEGKRQKLWYNDPPTLDILRINHYFGKSREEFEMKMKRGWADQPGGYVDYSRYDEYDRNEVFDDGILSYVSDIKSMM